MPTVPVDTVALWLAKAEGSRHTPVVSKARLGVPRTRLVAWAITAFMATGVPHTVGVTYMAATLAWGWGPWGPAPAVPVSVIAMGTRGCMAEGGAPRRVRARTGRHTLTTRTG